VDETSSPVDLTVNLWKLPAQALKSAVGAHARTTLGNTVEKSPSVQNST
jgi:hypothetical protein